MGECIGGGGTSGWMDGRVCGSKCGSRGEQGSGPRPPLENHVIWVSIGNKQLDPLEKLDPSGTLKNDNFL